MPLERVTCHGHILLCRLPLVRLPSDVAVGHHGTVSSTHSFLYSSSFRQGRDLEREVFGGSESELSSDEEEGERSAISGRVVLSAHHLASQRSYNNNHKGLLQKYALQDHERTTSPPAATRRTTMSKPAPPSPKLRNAARQAGSQQEQRKMGNPKHNGRGRGNNQLR